MEEFICAAMIVEFYLAAQKMIVEFYGVIHAMEKLKNWGLLMFGLSVILPWFVLRLLLRLMFRGCFVINEIFVLIIVEKSGLGLLISFVKRKCMCG